MRNCNLNSETKVSGETRRSRHTAILSTAFAALALSATPVLAQTVTVDPTGAVDNSTIFADVQSAIASFETADSTNGAGVNTGNPAPNVINIASDKVEYGIISVDGDAGAVGERVVVDGDLTINGKSGTGSILANYPGGGFTPSGFFWRQDVALTLNNLTIIPADTGLTTLCYFQQTSDPDVVSTVTLSHCVLTANKGVGVNEPVTTTGQDDPDLATAVTLNSGGDAMYAKARVEGKSLTINLDHTVIASFSPGTGSEDGIISYMNGATTDDIFCFLNVGPGCVFANIHRFAIQNPYGGAVALNGTAAEPVVFRNIASDAIWNLSDSSSVTQPVTCSSNYAHFFNIQGSALKEQETENRGFVSTVDNTVIVNCKYPGIDLFAAGALPTNGATGMATSTVTINNTVVHNSGSSATVAAYDNYASQIGSPTYTDGDGAHNSNRDVVMNNVTLSGTTAGLIGVYNSGTGSYTINDSTISTAGDNALTSASDGTGVITMNNVSNAAVTYTNMTDPFASDFFTPSIAAVADWNMY